MRNYLPLACFLYKQISLDKLHHKPTRTVSDDFLIHLYRNELLNNDIQRVLEAMINRQMKKRSVC